MGAGPTPILGALDQAGAQRIPLDVAENVQEGVIFLDGKGAKATLPDVAAGMVVLMITADMSGEQPHHVSAEFAVVAWPESQVEMVRQQAPGQQAHVEAFSRLAQPFDKGVEVAILVKNRAAAVPPV